MTQSNPPEIIGGRREPLRREPKNSAGLQRLGLWLGLVKFLSGTVALGMITLLFNQQYRNTQLDLERVKNEHAMKLQDRQAEITYLEHFMEHALDKDLKVRIALADYMKSAALTEDLREIWGRYFNVLMEDEQRELAREKDLEAKENDIAKQLAAIPAEQRDLRSAIVRKGAQEIQEIRLEIYDVWRDLDEKEVDRRGISTFNFYKLLEQAELAEDARHYEEQRDLLLKAYAGAPDSIRPAILQSLASAYRALGDFRNARLSMERAIAAGEPTANALVNLAILQKNDHQLNLALQTLRQADVIADDETKLTIRLVYAGYLIHAGQRDEGLRRFVSLQPELLHKEYFIVNIAWFYAVANMKDQFYEAFERALKLRPRETIRWVDEEVDIDAYRGEDRFRTLCPQCSITAVTPTPE